MSVQVSVNSPDVYVIGDVASAPVPTDDIGTTAGSLI
jgi:hypothetical protein